MAISELQRQAQEKYPVHANEHQAHYQKLKAYPL